MVTKIGICSFSFHRLLASGKQDMFGYIRDCKELGCTQLDPWNAHLAPLKEGDKAYLAAPGPAEPYPLSAADEDYLAKVKQAADEAGLPFGCIAVDGVPMYKELAEERDKSREVAYRWIDIAQRLGAAQLRFDTGNFRELTEEILIFISSAYRHLIERASACGIEVLVENHYGLMTDPQVLVRVLEATPGLGLLLDSYNWLPGRQAEGWVRCCRYARLTHVKTFAFADDGQELTQHIPHFINMLVDSGYDGAWGIESIPKLDEDEIGGARKTAELIISSLQN
ncbi:sugar phosphate isomerase/epimerase family protein [Paenibacillus cymbidii]|uniref:sugar phosphate isomerase/epimerase family protein n=1 Tax=Paenibacillus cymbidii TaxID=1639034 RepID=UPI001080C2EB|nr:TIM barrel protein [Paenibacillus cymbidii]